MKKRWLYRIKMLLGEAWFWLVAMVNGLIAAMVYSCNPDSPTITKEINQEYYYTHNTTGFATTSTIRFVHLYKNRNWWPDKKLAKFNMYVSGNAEPEAVELTYHQNRLTLSVDNQLMLDTMLDEDQCLAIDYNAW